MGHVGPLVGCCFAYDVFHTSSFAGLPSAFCRNKAGLTWCFSVLCHYAEKRSPHGGVHYKILLQGNIAQGLRPKHHCSVK